MTTLVTTLHRFSSNKTHKQATPCFMESGPSAKPNLRSKECLFIFFTTGEPSTNRLLLHIFKINIQAQYSPCGLLPLIIRIFLRKSTSITNIHTGPGLTCTEHFSHQEYWNNILGMPCANANKGGFCSEKPPSNDNKFIIRLIATIGEIWNRHSRHAGAADICFMPAYVFEKRAKQKKALAVSPRTYTSGIDKFHCAVCWAFQKAGRNVFQMFSPHSQYITGWRKVLLHFSFQGEKGRPVCEYSRLNNVDAVELTLSKWYQSSPLFFPPFRNCLRHNVHIPGH